MKEAIQLPSSKKFLQDESGKVNISVLEALLTEAYEQKIPILSYVAATLPHNVPYSSKIKKLQKLYTRLTKKDHSAEMLKREESETPHKRYGSNT